MNELILNGIVNATNSAEHAKALQMYEHLKVSETGWRECLQEILTGKYAGNSLIQFFCLQVLEYHVKYRYSSSSPADKELLRNFLRDWVKLQQMADGSLQEAFILNKAAQIAALVFVQDYPTNWPSFFTELISICEASPQFLSHYLRVLLAIDGEIADKEIPRSALELQRNTVIKDAMREKSVVQLVESWFKILTVLNGQYTLITCLCLQVIGKYIQWIDINLVANDRFVPLLVTNLCNHDIRESAADCIQEVISKGMDPIDKTKLVESFSRVLGEAGIWHAFVHDPDEDYLCRLGKLYCVMGTNLIESYHKFSKSHPGQTAEAKIMCDAIEAKVPLLLQILGNECDDVSATVLDFTRDYLHLIKSFRELSESNVKNYRLTVEVVVRKLRYDSSYDFVHEGEEEASFLDFRKQLKISFDNSAQLDKNYIIMEVQNRVAYTSQNWKDMPFDEVEVSLLLLYYLGESLPSSITSQWSASDTQPNPVQAMMIQIMNSDLYLYEHSAVVLQYFETIIRYEKFFTCHPDYIVKGLTAFLKEKGLFHPDKKVRSRCCYLFSRYIKCIRSGITPELMKNIIAAIQPLLALTVIPKDAGEDALITRDDQLYLYEVIGVLIVSGETPNQKKTALMTDIVSMVLYPCRIGMEQLKTTVKDPLQQESVVELLVQAIALTGRPSKAFSNQHTMKSLSCVSVFLDALGVFLQMLDVQVPETLMAQLQSAVRQYLHRLVVCLEEELLPYIPVASQGLLRNCDCRSIQEYIPLINQVITKFKKDVVPFLKQMFTPMVQGVFRALQVPIEPNDQIALRDRQLLRRQYFQFIAAIVTNNVIDVLAAQDQNVLQEVMMTVIQGSVDFPDPVAQKACFSILKKLIDLWAAPEGPEGFMDFMYKNIAPACFVAPLKPSFDINDAQTLIALNEIANCLKAIYDRRKEEFISYLIGYLPTLKVPLEKTQEFINALQADGKHFKAYLKAFFILLKSFGS